MSSNVNRIKIIAAGLGDLCRDVVFVGGSVAELYADDPAATDIRPTMDVDCVIELATYGSLQEFGDGVSAIPIETSNLRLYCIRLSDKILIFGNGGVKDCATWQESESLSDYVEMFVDTSRFISSRLSNGTLYILDKEIIGNLNFTRDEKK